MGCIYLDDCGICMMFNSDIETSACDEDGKCICCDDPDPSYLCEEYVSNE